MSIAPASLPAAASTMRIAYVTETWPPELNGVSLTVERTVRFLRARGHLVELIRPAPAGRSAPRRERRAAHRGLRHPDVPRPALRPRAPGHAGAALSPEPARPGAPGDAGAAAVGGARRGARPRPRDQLDFRTNFHQYTRHYGVGFLAGPALGLMRRFHNLTQRTFVPTQAARRELAAAGFHALTVIGRGVDTERFTPAARSSALRAQWQAGPDTPVLLAVGRVAARRTSSSRCTPSSAPAATGPTCA
jgi:glycosyltransferase involved in cell wall biosynthesis